MAAQPSIAPVVGFDYSAEPSKKTWTRQYVALAFGPGHENTIKQLFTRASELVEEHDIRLKAFSGHRNPRVAVKRKRDEIAPVLAGELGRAIQIAGILHSPSVSAGGCSPIKPDPLIQPRKLTDQADPYSASIRASVPLKPPQPEVAPLTTPRSPVPPLHSPLTPAPVTFRGSSVPLRLPQPTADLALADFEFNCFPPRIGKQTPSCKIRAEQLFAADFGATLQLEDFRVELLMTRLQIRNVISDLPKQCLMYDTPEGMIMVLDDEDLQNAVRYSRNHGRNSIKISVRTQDDTEDVTVGITEGQRTVSVIADLSPPTPFEHGGSPTIRSRSPPSFSAFTSVGPSKKAWQAGSKHSREPTSNSDNDQALSISRPPNKNPKRRKAARKVLSDLSDEVMDKLVPAPAVKPAQSRSYCQSC